TRAYASAAGRRCRLTAGRQLRGEERPQVRVRRLLQELGKMSSYSKGGKPDAARPRNANARRGGRDAASVGSGLRGQRARAEAALRERIRRWRGGMIMLG